MDQEDGQDVHRSAIKGTVRPFAGNLYGVTSSCAYSRSIVQNGGSGFVSVHQWFVSFYLCYQGNLESNEFTGVNSLALVPGAISISE
eukprot:3977699-Amphidinium_carterae.1